MNNGLLPLSSNAALRYDPIKGNLVVGDGDAARLALGTNVVVLGENNALFGYSENTIVLGTGHQVDGGQGTLLGKNNNNIVIGANNQIASNNQTNATDGNNIVIGAGCSVGTVGSTTALFKARNVVIGSAAKASGLDGVSIGTNSTTTSGVAIGSNTNSGGGVAIGATSTASSGIAMGGVSSDNGKSYAVGFYSGRPTTHGVFCVGNNGALGTAGASQYEIASAYAQTTDATTTELLTWVALTSRLTMPNDTSWGFTITLIARATANDAQSKMWFFKGGIRRGTAASTTALIGTPSVDTFTDTGTENWSASVAADSTNGGLLVNVQGVSGTTIRWHARVDSIQITG